MLLLTISAFGWQQQLHLTPPAGVVLSEGDQRHLRAGLSRLAARMESHRTNPHIVDIEIFSKAVQYALDGNEFFTAEDVLSR